MKFERQNKQLYLNRLVLVTQVHVATELQTKEKNYKNTSYLLH